MLQILSVDDILLSGLQNHINYMEYWPVPCRELIIDVISWKTILEIPGWETPFTLDHRWVSLLYSSNIPSLLAL